MQHKYAIIFFAWGEKFLREVENCIQKSTAIGGYDLLLITDTVTDLKGKESLFKQVISGDFTTTGLIRKSELINHLPSGYDAMLLLDSDTIVLEDISFGFEMALKHGIAMAPCHHNGLESFWNFRDVMDVENHPQRGQLQYNTGVIFFCDTPAVRKVLELWWDLSQKNQHINKNDQPYFTLAMEKLGFNPYTLPITYNYRGSGDAIAGKVRIWHSHLKMPEKINARPYKWPLRRGYPATMVYFDLNRFWYWPKRLIHKMKKAAGLQEF